MHWIDDLKRPHDSIKVMVNLGLIKRVRYVPAHWEYDIIGEE